MQILLNKHLSACSNIVGLFFLLGIFLLGNGCSHYYYVPNDNNLLALTEKGDIKVAGGGSFSGEFRNYALQAGYSPIKHVGLKGQFFRVSDRNGSLDNRGGTVYRNAYYGNGFAAEGSVGGYLIGRDWGREAKQERYLMPLRSSFDMYLGYGRGQINNSYANYNISTAEDVITGDTELKLNKYFLQAGAHLSLYSLSLHLGFRSSVLDYSKGVINGNIGEDNELDIYKIRSLDPIFTYETSFRFQVGIRHARLFFSGTAARYSEELNDLFKQSIFQVGGVLELDEIFKKKEKIPESVDF